MSTHRAIRLPLRTLVMTCGLLIAATDACGQDANAAIPVNGPVGICGTKALWVEPGGIPWIGCFRVAGGGTARGAVDGHRFVVTVNAEGRSTCQTDGVSFDCRGCIDRSYNLCPATIQVYSRDSDDSVLFSIARRIGGNTYVGNQENWDAELHKLEALRDALNDQWRALGAARTPVPNPGPAEHPVQSPIRDQLIDQLEEAIGKPPLISADSPGVTQMLTSAKKANPEVDPRTWDSVRTDTAAALTAMERGPGSWFDTQIRTAGESFTDGELRDLVVKLNDPLQRRFRLAFQSQPNRVGADVMSGALKMVVEVNVILAKYHLKQVVF